ncbi:MAG: hypothetical protein J6V09_07615 [Clostridia bacterium]|nr:hypothetical protein [Clostridia bacterium]
MDFDKNIKEIEQKIGYTFRDKSLLKQAFTRTSWCNEHKKDGYQSNEVLEFFGDSVLSAAIVTLLMKDSAKRYRHGISTELDEGDFSNIKSKTSDKTGLSVAMGKIGLEKYLLMGKGDVKLGIENEPSVKEDLFESIVGAIYIDSGYDVATVIKSVSKMLDVQPYMRAKEAPIQSHQNELKEFCENKKRRLPLPIYKTISETGPAHKKQYERACYVGDRIVGTGIGKNQKLADAEAARVALETLKREEKAASVSKKETNGKTSTQMLKEYADKEKLPSPEFRDLGESVNSKPSATEYEIECRFMGKSTRGVGPSKRDAKSEAARKMLAGIKRSGGKTQSTAPVQNKKNKKAAK